MEQIYVPLVLSLLFHSVLYFLISITIIPPVKASNLDKLHQRSVYLINTLYVAWSGTSFFFSSTSYGSLNTSDELWIVSVILGFWLFDTVLIIVKKMIDAPVIIHHIAIYLSCVSTLYCGRGAIDVITIFYLSEVTNWTSFLKNALICTEQKHTASYQLISVVFMSTFFIIRCVIATPVILYMALSDALVYNKIAAIILQVAIIHWGKPMPWIILKRYRTYMSRRAQGIRLPWFVPIEKIS